MMDKLSDVDWEVLVAFADNDMSIAETARKCYMNRSNVSYHLKKVLKHTGLDPYNFYDLTKLVGVWQMDNALKQVTQELYKIFGLENVNNVES